MGDIAKDDELIADERPMPAALTPFETLVEQFAEQLHVISAAWTAALGEERSPVVDGAGPENDWSSRVGALVSHYLAENPQHDAELRHVLSTMISLEREGLRRRKTTASLTASHPTAARPMADVSTQYYDSRELLFSFFAKHANDPKSIPTKILPLLGGFRMLRELGRGGMGVVFEAEQIALKRHVAVKVLSIGGDAPICPSSADAPVSDTSVSGIPAADVSQHVPDGLPLATDLARPQGDSKSSDSALSYGSAPSCEEATLFRTDSEIEAMGRSPSENCFIREARTVAKLHHTNVVPILEIGRQHGLYYYAMQLINGLSLDRLIRAIQIRNTEIMCTYGVPQPDTPAYFRWASGLFLQVLDALAHIHHEGVLHRDIKPGNLILERGGRVWITDFGLALPVQSSNSDTRGNPVGTLRYMAPEQCDGVATPLTDLYATGLTFYELLGLHPVFAATCREDLIMSVKRGGATTSLSQHTPHIPLDLRRIVEKAIHPESALRYASAEQFAGDLRCFLDDRPVLARPVSPRERFIRWKRRNPWIYYPMAIAFGAILVAVCTGWYGYLSTCWALQAANTQYMRAESECGRAEIQRGIAERSLALSREEQAKTREQRDRAEQNLTLALNILDETFPMSTSRAAFAVYTMPAPTDRWKFEKLLQFYEELAEKNQQNTRLQRETAQTFARIGFVYLMLGESKQAIQAFEQSLEYYAVVPEAEANQVEIARIHNELGCARRIGLSEATVSRETILNQCVDEHWRALRILAPLTSTPAMLEKIRTCNTLGILATDADTETFFSMESNRQLLAQMESDCDPLTFETVAEYWHRVAVRMADPLLTPQNRSEYAFAKAQSERFLIQSLRRKVSNSSDEILVLASDATALLRPLIVQNPSFTEYQKELAQVLVSKGISRTSLEEFVEAKRITERLITRYPYVPEYRLLIVGIESQMAMKYLMDGNLSAGTNEIYTAITHLNQLKMDFPELSGVQQMLQPDSTFAVGMRTLTTTLSPSVWSLLANWGSPVQNFWDIFQPNASSQEPPPWSQNTKEKMPLDKSVDQFTKTIDQITRWFVY